MGRSNEDRLLELIADVQGLLELEEFRVGLLHALGKVMPCDWISLNAIGPTPEDVWYVIEPHLPDELGERFKQLAEDNPLIERLRRTQDGRAYRFSDVESQQALHRRRIYTEVYAKFGMEHQIAFTLPSRPGYILGVALSRRRVDFDDDERDLLNRARPFLIQAYRNVLSFAELQTASSRLDRDTAIARLAAAGLTPREADVAHHVALGAPNQAVADAMGISVRTVQKHLEHVFDKLGVRSRSELAARVWAGAAGADR